MIGIGGRNAVVVAGMAVALAVLGLAYPSRSEAQIFQAAQRFSLIGSSADATPILVFTDVASPDGGPDGRPDIVVAAQTQRAAVLVGRDNGSFSSAPTTLIGRIPTALAVGDLDEDEVPDLFVVESGSTALVFRGHPLGPPFEQLGNSIAVARNPLAVVLADLNDDNHLDALVASEGSQANGEITILRGAGDGSFAPPPAPASSSVATGLGPAALVVEDFNDDGILDLAVVNSIAGNVDVFEGDSAGRFLDRQTIEVSGGTGAKAEPVAIGAADMNGDAILDLVIVNRNADQVGVLDGNPDGSFGNPRFFPSGAGGSTPTGLALVDLNDDGAIDVVIPNVRSSDVSVLLGNGSGQLGAPRAFVTDAESLAVAAGDSNDDGIPDVIVASRGGSSPTATVLRGDGSGALLGIEDLPSEPTPLDVLAGDFDNDGWCDAGLVFSSGRVRLFRSRGNAGFSPIAGPPVVSGGDVIGGAAADLDGNGLLDVVVANKGAGVVAVLRQLPGGSFAAPQTYNVGEGLSAIAAGDLNRDGRPDVVVARQVGEGDGNVRVLLGRADGTLGAPQQFAVGMTPIAIEIADVNGDALPDLLVANNVSSDVSILIGNGNGTFQVGRFASAGGGPSDVAAADFDRDGCTDFATSLPMARVTAVYYGDCTGAFVRGQQSLASADSPASVAARDVTGDGIPDAVISDQVDNSVSAYMKRAGDRFFQRGPFDNYVVSRRPIDVATGDFDGDGRYDAITANSFVAGSASVMTNISGPMVLRGDGNGDDRVTAADLVAVSREVGDADGIRIEDVGRSVYAAAGGVDANGDGHATAQDAIAVAHRTFPRL